MSELMGPAHELADLVRFSAEAPAPKSREESVLHHEEWRYLTQDALIISHGLTPDLEQMIAAVCLRLSVPRTKIRAVVSASPVMNARCLSLGQKGCLIEVTSSLIELLSLDELKFVIGHELGHWLLRHSPCSNEAGAPDVVSHMANRAQEISADRIGLIACSSVDIAIRSIIKTTSGLSTQYLRYDASAFLNQLRQADTPEDASEFYETHPPMLVRFRAILWFELTGFLTHGPAAITRDVHHQMDKRVLQDLERYVDRDARELLTKAKTDYAMWRAMGWVIRDGRFDNQEQRSFAGMFGEELLEKMCSFLTGLDLEEAKRLITARQDESRSYLEHLAPQNFQMLVDEIETSADAKFGNA